MYMYSNSELGKSFPFRALPLQRAYVEANTHRGQTGIDKYLAFNDSKAQLG